MTPEHHRIVIIGNGFSGLGAAIQLKRRGIEDFVLLDRGSNVGGTWRDNSYPGCACDVPSRLYSFSFAENPDWSRRYSPQPEIYAYMRKVAAEHDVTRHCRYDHHLLGADWQEEEQRWAISTSAGDYTADIVISGIGGLSEPALPDIPGIDSFAGTMFHSARWDHDHDLRGDRVAVIGTGASAIQFVPAIQPDVARIDLYQRTPPWLVPRMDSEIPQWLRRVYRRIPALMTLSRAIVYASNEITAYGMVRRPKLLKLVQAVALKHMHRQVKDPSLRATLTPDYQIGCKRILRSDDYYPAVAKDNVDVITTGIAEIRPNAVVTTDGTVREVDTIILGTGFRVTDMPLLGLVRGRDGVLLGESGDGTMRTLNGTMFAGFPNFFTLLGPNTALGHTSVVYMIESQLNLVMDAITTMERRGAATVEPLPEAVDRFVAEVDERGARSVWLTGGCSSWYLDATGRNATLWPGFTFEFRARTRHFVEAQYALGAPHPAREPVAA